MLKFFKSIFSKPLEKPHEVILTATSISFKPAEGDEQTILKKNINRIKVQTGSGGPWREDMWFLFYTTADETLIIPSESKGNEDLVDFIIGIAGDDNQNFINAMSSTSNNIFDIWGTGFRHG